MTQPAHPAGPAHYRLTRTAIFGGFLGFFVSGGIVSLYGPSAPAWRRLFGVEELVSGLPASIHPLLAMLGIMLWALLARRVGAGRVLAVGAAVMGIGAAGVAFAPGITALLAWVVLVGFGFGVLANGMNTIYPRDSAPSTPMTVGLMHGCFGAGAVLLPFVLSVTGYAGAYLMMAVVTLLAVPLLLGVPRPPVTTGSGDGAVAGDRGSRVWFAAMIGVFIGLEASTATWTATYLEGRGWSEPAAARWTSVFWLVFTIGRFLYAPIAGRIRPGIVPLILMPAAAVSLLAAGVPALAPYGIAAGGLFMAAMFPVSMIWLARVLPFATGATTLAVTAAMVGATLAPALVGVIVSWLGVAVIPFVLATLAVVAALLAGRVGRRLGLGGG